MDTRRIVERGAVIASYPYDGSWRACIRYEGDVYGKVVGPVFSGPNANADANAYAAAYR